MYKKTKMATTISYKSRESLKKSILNTLYSRLNSWDKASIITRVFYNKNVCHYLLTDVTRYGLVCVKYKFIYELLSELCLNKRDIPKSSIDCVQMLIRLCKKSKKRRKTMKLYKQIGEKYNLLEAFIRAFCRNKRYTKKLYKLIPMAQVIVEDKEEDIKDKRKNEVVEAVIAF